VYGVLESRRDLLDDQTAFAQVEGEQLAGAGDAAQAH
jgi:hypothetical protein